MKLGLTEYRDGNYVQLSFPNGYGIHITNGSYNYAISIDNKNKDEHHNSYPPIRITPQLLIEIGFRFGDNSYYLELPDRNILIIKMNDLLNPMIIIKGQSEEIVSSFKCSYIHDLQNIYFDKTKDNLPIKLV